MQAVLACVLLMLAPFTAFGADPRTPLDRNWRIQTSEKIEAGGAVLSKPGVDTAAWIPVTVPTTVMGALVANGQFKDPYTAMNLRSIPGTSYEIGSVFARQPMPLDSPYPVSWWYRTQFAAPAEGTAAGGTPGGANHPWPHLHWSHYHANTWFNGTPIT